jgi:hypothetical protein
MAVSLNTILQLSGNWEWVLLMFFFTALSVLDLFLTGIVGHYE